MNFTYTVNVEVPDENFIVPENLDIINEAEWWDDEGNSITPYLTPEQMARIVMNERLGCDEEYGFHYTVTYKSAE